MTTLVDISTGRKQAHVIQSDQEAIDIAKQLATEFVGAALIATKPEIFPSMKSIAFQKVDSGALLCLRNTAGPLSRTQP